MLKTQILEILQNAGKCRNKIQQLQTAIKTHLNTEIFCQGDPGKTPYNSWGKPVRELFFISENYLFTVRNIQQKISKQIYNLSLFPCLTTIWKLQQTGQQ